MKMMICSKLKIYEYSKLIISFNGKIVSTLNEKTPVSNIFPSNEVEINLIICLDNNLLNTSGVDWNKLTIKSENQTNPSEILSSNQNLITTNNNQNQNATNSISNTSNNIQSQSEKRENLFYVMCGCNLKSEALYVCFACGTFICESCKRREPHLSHTSHTIRVSKAQDYIKAFAKQLAMKLNISVLQEESYLECQSSEKQYLSSLKAIELKFSGLKEYIFNLKNNQISYLNRLKDKLKLKENFSEANLNLEQIKKQIDSFAAVERNFKDLDFQVNLRKNINSAVDVLERKMSGIKMNLFFYLKSHKEIKSFNKTLNRSLKEMHFHTQTNYKEASVNSKLANFLKGILISLFNYILYYL